jgi:hypothetical protein
MADNFAKQLAMKIEHIIFPNSASLPALENLSSAQKELEEFCIANGQDVSRLDEIINEVIEQISLNVQ